MENSKMVNRIAGFHSLQTQQCRLRHLRSLAARNVHLKKRRTSLDITQLQMFFTLHKDPNSSPYYTSEKIRGSLNPVWKNFSLVHLNEGQTIDTTSQSLTVRVWYGQTELSDADYSCCVRWDVYLPGLVYLGSKILNDGSQHSPNTLIFGLHEGFYGAAPAAKEANVAKELKTFTVEADSSQIRFSYSTRSLMRVQTVLRAIKQTQREVTREQRAINAQLLDIEHLRRKKAQRELALLKVNMIRSDLQWRMTQLQGLETSHETSHIENLHREATLRKRHDQLINDSEILHERKKRYFDVRDELIKTGAQLVLRRKQLLSELAFIYPIQRLPNNEDRICGVHLPHSEGFAGHDETQIAVALGYTCHLVMMISNFLDIPLRYPMDHRGSKSMIRDHIITKLSEKERDFPLFSKGKEKYQFQYGVFILNKNIAQLRHYCGMTTPDLRQTLANISTLLCDRLGITTNRNDAFSNQHSLIPPSFGGPQKSCQAPHNLNQATEIVKDIPASSLDLSLRINQADPRLEEIKEEGGEQHPNTVAVTTKSELSECKEISVTKGADLDLSIASRNADLKSYSNHRIGEGQNSGVCVLYNHVQDCPSPHPREGPSSNTPGTPCADDVDASSTEDTDSLLYQSHFGKWDSAVNSSRLVGVEEDLAEQKTDNSREYDAGIDGLRRNQSDAGKEFGGGCDAEPIKSTFKTWNLSNKEWEKHWNQVETEDNGSINADKFSDNGTSDA